MHWRFHTINLDGKVGALCLNSLCHHCFLQLSFAVCDVLPSCKQAVYKQHENEVSCNTEIYSTCNQSLLKSPLGECKRYRISEECTNWQIQFSRNMQVSWEIYLCVWACSVESELCCHHLWNLSEVSWSVPHFACKSLLAPSSWVAIKAPPVPVWDIVDACFHVFIFCHRSSSNTCWVAETQWGQFPDCALLLKRKTKDATHK